MMGIVPSSTIPTAEFRIPVPTYIIQLYHGLLYRLRMNCCMTRLTHEPTNLNPNQLHTYPSLTSYSKLGKPNNIFFCIFGKCSHLKKKNAWKFSSTFENFQQIRKNKLQEISGNFAKTKNQTKNLKLYVKTSSSRPRIQRKLILSIFFITPSSSLFIDYHYLTFTSFLQLIQHQSSFIGVTCVQLG